MVSCFCLGGPLVGATILDFQSTSPVRWKTSEPRPGRSMLRCIWMCSLPSGVGPPSASSTAKVRSAPASACEWRSISLRAWRMDGGLVPKSSSAVTMSDWAISATGRELLAEVETDAGRLASCSDDDMLWPRQKLTAPANATSVASPSQTLMGLLKLERPEDGPELRRRFCLCLLMRR